MNGPTILPAAPANDLTADQLRVRPGEDGTVAVSAAHAGWRYLGFATRSLGKGERMPFRLESSEAAILVLSGGGVTVEVNGRQPVELAGRRTVFDGLPWAIYLPPGVRGRVVGRPIRGAGRTVIGAAVAPVVRRSSGREPIAITPDDVSVEIRGAGNATRQVNHIITPDFPADRLELVEILTPGGNWSSWPPHKHDVDAMPDEAVLEEIYLYQFRRAEAWAIQRLYRADRSRDALWEVRHGDLVLVPDGYHPFAAAHGDDAYYLNALAGDHRTMACTDDPNLAWVRGSWADMEPDPRLPLVKGHAVGSRASVVPRVEDEAAPAAGDDEAAPAAGDDEAAPAAGDDAPAASGKAEAGSAPAWTSELEDAPDAGADWSEDVDERDASPEEPTTSAPAETDDDSSTSTEQAVATDDGSGSTAPDETDADVDGSTSTPEPGQTADGPDPTAAAEADGNGATAESTGPTEATEPTAGGGDADFDAEWARELQAEADAAAQNATSEREPDAATR